MAKFEKVFDFTKEKNVEAVMKALQGGRGQEYLNAMCTEAQGAGAMNLSKAQIMITANYVCYYGNFKRSIVILPIQDIVNVYRSNCFYGSYDYNFMAIAVETKNNELFYFSKCSKNQNVADFTTALGTLMQRAQANAANLVG